MHIIHMSSMHTITTPRTGVDKCGEDVFVSFVRRLHQHSEGTFRTQHGHKICEKSKNCLLIAEENYIEFIAINAIAKLTGIGIT